MRVQKDEYKRRQVLALELRRKGKSYPTIAKKVGWKSPSSAYEAVNNALDAVVLESAERLRKLESIRLDSVWDDLEEGTIDPPVAGAKIKVQERRAKLFGLDAASKTELTGKDGGPIQVERTPEEVTRGIQAFREAILRAQQPAGGSNGNGASGGNGTPHP